MSKYVQNPDYVGSEVILVKFYLRKESPKRLEAEIVHASVKSIHQFPFKVGINEL